jgi:hypothetical protein
MPAFPFADFAARLAWSEAAGAVLQIDAIELIPHARFLIG